MDGSMNFSGLDILLILHPDTRPDPDPDPDPPRDALARNTQRLVMARRFSSQLFQLPLSHASAAKAPAFSKLLLAMTAGATAGVFLSERNRTFSAEEKKNFSIAKSYSEISKQRLSRYQSLFLKNASVEDPQGNPFLSKADFLKAIKPELDLIDIDVEKFSALFDSIFDSSEHSVMSFEDFVTFLELVKKPDAEYEIAFKIVDQDRNGVISLEEFKRVIQANLSPESPPFNWESEWLRMFFPQNRNGISYEEFTQLLKGLPSERIRQEFRFYDTAKSGIITGEEFEKIIKHVRFRNIPPIIKKDLKSIEMATNHGSDNKPLYGVSYPQIIAFSNLLLHIPSYGRVLKTATQKFRTEKIDKQQFLSAAQKATTIEITPMEVDLIFHFFDTQKDGLLDFSEFEKILVLEKNILEQEKKIRLEEQQQQRSLNQNRSIGSYIQETIVNFALGGIAGAIGATAVYPIDLVKTRMQNQRIAIGQTTRLYENSLDCFKKVFRNEGFLGLYKGLGPQVIGVAPEKAIKLVINDLLRSLFKDPEKGNIYLPLEILAGGGAGASQVIFTNPLEIVKIRLQTQGELAKSGTQVERVGAIQIVRELGISGLYKGAGACLLRDIPFSGMYFPLYAKMKEVMKDDSTGKIGPEGLLIAGAVAGIPAAGLSTPADVIKTRLQVKARTGEVTYSGIRDCFWKVLQAEGPRAFWKGALARIFRSSPQFGVTLLSYELLQRYFLPANSFGRPPTNVPVDPEEMEAAFGERSVLGKIEKVESNWFSIYQDPKDKE